MVSLARLSLLYDWKRYLAAVLAVAFSGLLVLVQIGLLLGQLGTVTVVLEKARADLWAVAPNTESFDLARDMPASNEMSLRMHPDVMAVQEMIFGFGDWRTPDGGKVMVYVIGLNTTADSLSLPQSFKGELQWALRESGGVVVDIADLNKLQTHLGQSSEVNGKSVSVLGVTKGFRAIGGAYIFTSISTAKELMEGLIDPDYVQFLLLHLRDPKQVESVRMALMPNVAYPPYTLLTPQEFAYQSQDYWMTESGSGASFAFSALLALMVGIAITSQTLKGAILASIKEYATLRALGVSVTALRYVVLEQAFWVGIIGLIITALFTYLIYILANTNYIPIRFPISTIIGAGIFMLCVAIIAGLFALKPLYQTEPADLLR